MIRSAVVQLNSLTYSLPSFLKVTSLQLLHYKMNMQMFYL